VRKLKDDCAKRNGRNGPENTFALLMIDVEAHTQVFAQAIANSGAKDADPVDAIRHLHTRAFPITIREPLSSEPPLNINRTKELLRDREGYTRQQVVRLIDVEGKLHVSTALEGEFCGVARHIRQVHRRDAAPKLRQAALDRVEVAVTHFRGAADQRIRRERNASAHLGGISIAK